MLGLEKLTKAAGVSAIRHQVVSRIGLDYQKYKKAGKEAEFYRRVRDLIDSLNNMQNTDLLQYASEKELEIARKLASKYPNVIIEYLNVDNVLMWLLNDVPVAYGILVGHPNGIRWLNEVINNIKQKLLGITVEPVD